MKNVIKYCRREFVTKGTDSTFDSEPYKVQEYCEWQLSQLKEKENIIIFSLLFFQCLLKRFVSGIIKNKIISDKLMYIHNDD